MKHDPNAWKRRIFWPPKTADGRHWIPVERVIAEFYPDVSEDDLRSGCFGEIKTVIASGRTMRFVHSDKVEDARGSWRVRYGSGRTSQKRTLPTPEARVRSDYEPQNEGGLKHKQSIGYHAAKERVGDDRPKVLNCDDRDSAR